MMIYFKKHLLLRFHIVFFTFLLLCFQVYADSSLGLGGAQRSTDWMYAGKFGLSSHYFAHSPSQLEQLAGQLKIDEVANQAADSGAAWFLFTVYHQPWVMMAPNETYDQILGEKNYTSTRDIPMELYTALNKKDIRLMLYVNLRLDPKSEVSPHVRKAMGGWPPNDKLVHNIAAVYREFSLRYGKKVSGWWVDGVQIGSAWDKSPHRERWFKEIADALRAGNSDALVAFNPGHSSIRYSAQNDYIAGESVDLARVPNERWIDGAQWHVWTYLGESWGSGGTRFTNKNLLDYANLVAKKGGVMTFEVGMRGLVKRSRSDHGIQIRENIGRIDPAQVEQIRFMSKGVSLLAH
jgi:hypothetical protein